MVSPTDSYFSNLQKRFLSTIVHTAHRTLKKKNDDDDDDDDDHDDDDFFDDDDDHDDDDHDDDDDDHLYDDLVDDGHDDDDHDDDDHDDTAADDDEVTTITDVSLPTSSPTLDPNGHDDDDHDDDDHDDTAAADDEVTTIADVLLPTSSPTLDPTAPPTVTASGHPTVSGNPTTSWNPTAVPSSAPTVTASGHPTLSPTYVPTKSPSVAPSDNPTITPSAAPSQSPTVTPPCIDDLARVYEMEANNTNPSVQRRYRLCPDTEFDLGYLNPDGEIVDGQPYLMLRPNVIYQCGDDGSRSNNCILRGGDFAVTSFYGVFDGIYESVENTRIEGLTFVGQSLFAAVLEAAGDITFVDCAWLDQVNVAPILIQWEGLGPQEVSRGLRSEVTGFQHFHRRRVQALPDIHAGSMESKRRRSLETFYHRVTFQACLFRDNKANKEIGFPGIIENSYRSELVIKNSLFEHNDYGESNNPAPFGYAIRSFGPVHIEDSCFNDNTFIKDGPVVVYGANYNATNNFATPSMELLSCNLIAVFYSLGGLTGEETPDCVEADVDVCNVKLYSTPRPTLAPTQAPTTIGILVFDTKSSAPRIQRVQYLCASMMSVLVASLL